MTEGNLQKIIQKGVTSTENVERISKALSVSPIVFFDEYQRNSHHINQNIGEKAAASVYGNASIQENTEKQKNNDKITAMRTELELLRSLLEEKERTVREKERTIQILMKSSE
jgi:hypothetical protein